MQRSQLLIIFFIVFIILVGFGLIMPLMPFYIARYGGSAFLVGLLVATYALAQFIGAPVTGRLSDRLGRRPVLAASMAVTALGFLLLALAEPLGKALASVLSGGSASIQAQNVATLGVMFLSRLVTGLAGGSITVAQAYIADITDEQNRTKGMGLIGAAFGLGFVVGPLLGGVLSQWGYAAPAYAAAGLSLLSLVGILFLLPESLSAARKAELANQPKQSLISLPGIFRKLGQPRLGPLLIVRLFVSLAGALFMALFTLWAMQRLGLDSHVTSYLMAYIGVLGVITQIGLIPRLTVRFTSAWLMVVSIAVLAVTLLAWAFTPNIAVLLIVMIPHGIATGVLNTVINSATSWSVPPQEMGDALGTSTSLESLARIIAPTLGGWLLGAVGAWAPGALGAVLMAGLAPYAWQRLVVHPDPPLGEIAFFEKDEILPATV